VPAAPDLGDEIPNLIVVAVTPVVSVACAGTVLSTIAPAVINAEAITARFVRVFLIIYFLP
jgi:hypothetical protein